MITYEQAIAALKDAICPDCLHSELSAELHLDYGSECLCTARCEHCGRQFDIEFTRFKTLNQLQRQVEAVLAATRCAVCGQVNYALSLQCERFSKDCYFQARCQSCGTAYHVKRRQTYFDLIRQHRSTHG